MAINWIETEVIEHIKWTDSLASLKFKGTVLPYTSGQFTKVGLEIDGELVSRPYSYVSSPNDNFLEIVYVNVPDGVLTPKLHNLKVGDKLMAMEKSSGFFSFCIPGISKNKGKVSVALKGDIENQLTPSPPYFLQKLSEARGS